MIPRDGRHGLQCVVRLDDDGESWTVGELLPEDESFDDLEIPFFCNSVRLETGGSIFWGSPGFRDVSLVDAVYASCALPGIFEPFRHGDYHHMDGGIRAFVKL